MRKEKVTGQYGGWVLYQSLDPTITAWLRFVERAGRWVLVELRIDQGIDTDTLRSLPLGRLDAFANGDGSRRLRQWIDKPVNFSAARRMSPDLKADEPAIPEMRLDVPDGRADYGDDFYRRVARLYSSAAARVRAPAMALAEANDVPVTTARRWIKEARARGFLPAGRAGKAG